MSLNEDLATIEREGYVVIRDLLSPAEVEELRSALAPELAKDRGGRNTFEGFRTQRIYTLAARGDAFGRLAEHPRVLALADALLEPSYLLTASQAIAISPGETPQPWHADDTFYSLPRPRRAISLSTIVAIDPFTTENGATQLIPRSHLWGDEEVRTMVTKLGEEFATVPREQRNPREPVSLGPRFEDGVVDATMPSGDCIVFLGTLLHRGGRNRSSATRLAVSNQYCQPWARQQENFTLAVPPERAQQLSPRLAELLGYSIHPPFMGHAGGMHPLRYKSAL